MGRPIAVAIFVASMAIMCARDAAAEPPEKLVGQLENIVGALPIARTGANQQVLIVEGALESSTLSFHSLDRSKLAEAMAVAVQRRGMIPVVAKTGARDPEVVIGMIGAMAGAIMYEGEVNGSDIEMTVYSFEREQRMIFRMDVSVDVNGVVAWNLAKLSGFMLAIVVIVGGIAGWRWYSNRPRYEDVTPAAARTAVAVPPVPASAPPARASVAEDIPLSDGALAMLASNAPIELELATGPSAPGIGHDRTLAASPAARGERGSAPPSKILDRYRIVGELGRGAMGVVYRAYDENLEREVAVKAMADQVAAHPDALKMFTSEARALAQLNHPNIVSIYDQFTDRGHAYLIMELIDGITLERVISEKGRYAWRDALLVAYHLCAGLAYAHGKNVIHRDIKPANIFLTRDGDIKLGDFGLARVLREVAIRNTEVRGTPLYMAPEQVTGTNIDVRADLYAVGCTLFELLTGRPPFFAGDILYHHVYTEPPAPSSVVSELPAEVDRLVLSLLAKRAYERPESAQAVRTTIRSIAT